MTKMKIAKIVGAIALMLMMAGFGVVNFGNGSWLCLLDFVASGIWGVTAYSMLKEKYE
jgi:hypothetical protein